MVSCVLCVEPWTSPSSFLMKHGNTAMQGRQAEVVKDSGPKDWFDQQVEVLQALGVREAVW